MKKNRLQCKDIPDRPILEMLAKRPGVWHTWCCASRPEDDVATAMPEEIPWNLVLAKMRMLKLRKLVDGCTCGCRGDFVITEKGLAWLEASPMKESNEEN